MVVVRVLGGHIMKLNHSTDYKQLKLLCRSMRKLERKGVVWVRVRWWMQMMRVIIMATIEASASGGADRGQ